MIKKILSLTIAILGLVLTGISTAADSPQKLGQPALNQRFAQLALDCVQKTYPNKIAHVLSGEQDVLPPPQLTPVFYGCYDWHSAVHGHWLLIRLLRLYPQADFAAAARNALEQNFTTENIQGEVDYISADYRASFERPYGIAWFLQLMAELYEWEDDQGQQWRQRLQPLESLLVNRFAEWLDKLVYPIRVGEHSQTAFAFGLIADWAAVTGNQFMQTKLKAKSLVFYQNDQDCPLAYEPSGQDFLSPCLAEADLMRRYLEPEAYARWLKKFLPELPKRKTADWLPLTRITDRVDGKLAHLDGLHLSRAWMIEGIASGLPVRDRRRKALLAAAAEHREAGLAAVTGEHYAGGHWLGSFATYLVTRRGIAEE